MLYGAYLFLVDEKETEIPKEKAQNDLSTQELNLSTSEPADSFANKVSPHPLPEVSVTIYVFSGVMSLSLSTGHVDYCWIRLIYILGDLCKLPCEAFHVAIFGVGKVVELLMSRDFREDLTDKQGFHLSQNLNFTAPALNTFSSNSNSEWSGYWGSVALSVRDSTRPFFSSSGKLMVFIIIF